MVTSVGLSAVLSLNCNLRNYDHLFLKEETTDNSGSSACLRLSRPCAAHTWAHSSVWCAWAHSVRTACGCRVCAMQDTVTGWSPTGIHRSQFPSGQIVTVQTGYSCPARVTQSTGILPHTVWAVRL